MTNLPTNDNDILTWPAHQLARAIRDGRVSPHEAVEASLERIDRINPVVNAFANVYPDALEQADALARHADSATKAGLLFGVPVAIKETTPMAGRITAYGSRAFAHHVADRDAWVVRALKRHGAIIVGQTTAPEFAYSGFTASPLHGVTRNPRNPAHTSGGSSGGSAAAVAAHAVPLAQGSDMGGSIRIPASHCGIAGLKPSLGRIPLDGLPSTFDDISHVGPLARSCADIALFLDVAQGPDDCDIQSIPSQGTYFGNLDADPTSWRIALSADLDIYAVDADVETNLMATSDRLRQAGATVEPVTIGWTRDILAIWNDYWNVTLAAYYGDTFDRHADLLDPAVCCLIEAGRKLSAVDYKRLEIGRTRAWNAFRTIFSQYDALICPTTAITAPSADLGDDDFGWLDADGRCHGMSMTGPFNLIGPCPVLSVPSGFDRNGLPTGVQIVGRRHDDLGVLRIGHLLERQPPVP